MAILSTGADLYGIRVVVRKFVAITALVHDFFGRLMSRMSSNDR
eukprot:COSAG02_NODE_2388_length_8979_cov_6.381081_7_plen_44_part_00